MTLESLLLSQDTELVRVLRPTLEKMSIDVEVCHEARTGSDILISDKFDAVIVDCDDMSGGLALLQGLRSYSEQPEFRRLRRAQRKENDHSGSLRHGREFRAAETAQRPERVALFPRRAQLHAERTSPLLPATGEDPGAAVLEGKKIIGTSTNVSEGGMAVIVHEALPKGAAPHLKFTLPGPDFHMEVETEVAWSDVKGLAGFRFLNVPKSSQMLLERWLDERMEQEFPGAKERLASAESGIQALNFVSRMI